MKRTALVVGATGLIGKQLLQFLLEDDAYEKVKAITRKALDAQHPKLDNRVVDFNRLTDSSEYFNADDIFCCLGTTIRIAKTKEAFRKVDFEYPLEVARLAKGEGAKQYLLVSSLGASKTSNVFYNKVKGEVEEAIRKISFDSYHIFRPSLLLGDRLDNRAGEGAAMLFFRLFGFLVPMKYKAIESVKIARAMLTIAKANHSGIHIHESKELQGY